MSENKNLKLRFKLKELEFEIEGNERTVKAEFENFKDFVTNDILPQINKVSSAPETSELESRPLALDQAPDIDLEDTSDFPILKELVYKDLPKNEKEWVLVYCFYASAFGSKSFTRDDISTLYESSNRKSDETVKRLSRNVRSILNKDYIKMINDEEYIIKPEGIKQAKLILEGKSNARASYKNTSKKPKGVKEAKSLSKPKPSSKKQDFKLDRNLNLRPEGEQSLKEFSESFEINSAPERILVIVYYLKEILQMDNVNTNHIYTAFDKLNVRVPKSLYQLISDTKNKNGWLEFDSMDDIAMSIQGRNAIKYDLPKTRIK
ncbi:hypothetical protein [Allomuricauda sp. SCSIO 65647]|uniref:hypothetical protein n=1 Tax=Allomuricauda sp. SCSIO 65647 TaxID=2908843 RepID=UPI001F3A0D8B|nr:hypothetical protein [Muricauda sp. SCSIO 65647]UJH67718.1 hypothetical protein L0P89_00520 [Muricauda sp. SCSIO 65647]